MKARRKNAQPHPQPPLRDGDMVEGLIAQTITSIHLSVLQLRETPKKHKRLDWLKATYQIAGSELSNCLEILNKYSRQSLRRKHGETRELMRETLETLLELGVEQAKSTRSKAVISMAQTLIDFLERAHIIMSDGAYNQETIEAESSPRKRGSDLASRGDLARVEHVLKPNR
jgi:hypothetical protein